MKANEILEIIRKDNDRGAWYGLRSCDEKANIGDVLQPSVNWDLSNIDEDGDYDKDEYKLNGSSAVSIGDFYDAEDADMENILAVANKYPGCKLYLVKGTFMDYGSDGMEAIISANGGDRGAEVVAEIE